MTTIEKKDLFNELVCWGASTDGRVEIGSMNDDSLIKMAKTIPEVFSNSSELESCISLSGRATASNLEAAYKQAEAFASGLAIFADVFRERVSDPIVQEKFSKAFLEIYSNTDKIRNTIASKRLPESGGGSSVPEGTDSDGPKQLQELSSKLLCTIAGFLNPEELNNIPECMKQAIIKELFEALSKTYPNADEIRNAIAASRMPAGSGRGSSVPEDTDLSMIIRKYQRDGANPRPIYQVLEFFDPREFFDKPGYIQRAIKYAQEVKEEGRKGWIIRGCCNHDLSNIKTSKEDFINYLKTFGQVETKTGTYYGIKKLTIPYNLRYSLNDDDVEEIVKHCPNLEHLDLSGCTNITNEGIDYLSTKINDDKGISKARLYKLRHLNLSKCGVNGKILHGLKNLYELTHLSLSGISGILDEHLVDLNKKLEYLDLKESTSDLTDVGLTTLSELVNITYLFLGGRNEHFTGEGLRCLTAALVHLTRLDISNWRGISGEELIYLKGLRNLTHLSARFIKISDEHLVHLNEKLEYLDLHRSVGDLTDVGLNTLSKLVDITHLFLGGGNKHFTGKGLSCLTAALTKLTCLDISRWRQLFDDDLVHLVELRFLTHLLLNHANLNLTGLTTLSKVPSLTHLCLGGTSLLLTSYKDSIITYDSVDEIIFVKEVENILVTFPKLKYLNMDLYYHLRRIPFNDERDVFMIGKVFYKKLENPKANYDETRNHAIESTTRPSSYWSVDLSALRRRKNASGGEIYIVNELPMR